MELRDIARDLFLFVATFKERLDHGQPPQIPALQHEVRTIFSEMDQKTRQNPALSARYEKLKYGLVALVDEIIVSSTWIDAPNWPVLELELYNSSVAGNRVYDQIRGLTPADMDLIEGYFFILALGFRGQYAFEEEKWSETLLQLYRQLPQKVDLTDFKLSPEAYQVIKRKSRRLDPLFSLWRSVLIFAVSLVILIVFYQVVWHSMVNGARAKSEEVRNSISDPGLRQSLQDVKP